jgi:hypothetical protein
MMKKLFLFIAAIIYTNLLIAQAAYSVSTIPDSLLKKANAVKRLENIRFEIKNKTAATLKYKCAYTILNENGDQHAQFVEWYDKMREIASIEGTLYDASGKQLKKLKNKDIQDLSGVDDISLMDDNRKKVHNFYYKVYPYTVEYEVEIKQNQTFHFPSWITQESEHLSVEKTSFSLICPSDYAIRYRALNYTGEPQIISEKNQKMYTWSLKNKPAVVKETFSPRWHELTTMLSVAPTEFEVQGYRGNMTSWKEFGQFLYELKRGRDVLPGNIKQKVQELTAGASNEKEKVKKLYQYLQQNTRYISIQLGIGGWQPFDASYVASKGYGDCKALTNYMYSLLKEANIPSYYALIKAGARDYYMLEDFPSNQFNHAVLCVPLQKDTMWLECTSQSAPAGYMGDFTGNRKALIIDENGGSLVSTPRYRINDNLQLRTIAGKIDETGKLQAKVKTKYGAIQQDNLHQMINSLSKEKIKEVLQKELELATYNVNAFDYNETKSEHPEIVEQLDVDVSNYATVSGKRLFITPNVLNRSNAKLTAEEQRQTAIHIDFEYRDIDSVIIDVPAGYEPESMPKPVLLQTKFGNYAATMKLEGHRVVYTRVREQYAGKYPPKDYQELMDYYERIYKADRSRVVLIKLLPE